MKKLIMMLIVSLFCGSCVIISIKENHYHIHNGSGSVEVEGTISGSEADGNEIKPVVTAPLTP